MVTHLPIASGDGVSVKSAFRRVVATRLLAAAAAAGVTVRASRAGGAVLTRAVGRRRGVRVLRHRAAALVVVLLGGGRGDGGAAVRAVRLRYVVWVFRGRVGAVVDVLLRGLRRGAAAVRTVRLWVAVVVAVRVELSGIRGCGGHDDL